MICTAADVGQINAYQKRTKRGYLEARNFYANPTKVRETPSWPRSWANFSLLQLYFRRNAWANLDLLGHPNTFLA